MIEKGFLSSAADPRTHIKFVRAGASKHDQQCYGLAQNHSANRRYVRPPEPPFEILAIMGRPLVIRPAGAGLRLRLRAQSPPDLRLRRPRQIANPAFQRPAQRRPRNSQLMRRCPLSDFLAQFPDCCVQRSELKATASLLLIGRIPRAWLGRPEAVVVIHGGVGREERRKSFTWVESDPLPYPQRAPCCLSHPMLQPVHSYKWAAP